MVVTEMRVFGTFRGNAFDNYNQCAYNHGANDIELGVVGRHASQCTHGYADQQALGVADKRRYFLCLSARYFGGREFFLNGGSPALE